MQRYILFPFLPNIPLSIYPGHPINVTLGERVRAEESPSPLVGLAPSAELRIADIAKALARLISRSSGTY